MSTEEPKIAPVGSTQAGTSVITMTSEDRRQLLANAIHGELLQGRRVESSLDFQAVLVKGKRVNHVLHLILSVLTGLLWVPVWILVAIRGGEKRVTINIDNFGHVIRRKV